MHYDMTYEKEAIHRIKEHLAETCTRCCENGIALSFTIEVNQSITRPYIMVELRLGKKKITSSYDRHMVMQYNTDIRWFKCSVEEMITSLVRSISWSS